MLVNTIAVLVIFAALTGPLDHAIAQVSPPSAKPQSASPPIDGSPDASHAFAKDARRRAEQMIERRAGTLLKNSASDVVWVDLADSQIRDSELAHLAAFTELQSLNLSRTKTSDVGLAYVGMIAKLEILYLTSCTNLTDRGLESMDSLQRLRFLDIGQTEIADQGVRLLAGLKNLEDLDLTGVPVTDLGAVHLRRLTKLKTLCFSKTYDEDLRPPLVSVAAVNQLRAWLPACRIEHEPPGDRAAAIEAMRVAAERVQELNQERRRIARIRAAKGFAVSSREDLEVVLKEMLADVQSHGAQIVGIDLHDHFINDEFLAYLRFVPELRTLGLAKNAVSDDGLARLPRLPELRSLSLSRTRVGDAGLAHLRRFPRLSRLNLSELQISDRGLKSLEPLGELKELFLMDTGITDGGLQYLEPLGQLKRLYLINTKVTDAGLVRLANLKELEWLDLSGTAVTESGVAALRSRLPHCKVHLWLNAQPP